MPLFRRKPQGVPADVTAGDERAARIVQALPDGDLEALRSALGEARSVEEHERLLAVLADAPGHPAALDAWTQQEPESADAWLARGTYGIAQAWDARGAAYADRVDEDAWEVFFERLREAEDDLLKAAGLDPANALPWSQLIISGRGLQIPKEELRIRYDETQSRHPWLPEAHAEMLQGLCAKWSGSDEEALAFVRFIDREAPDGAPARASLAMAHLEVWLGLMDDDPDPDAYLRRDDVRDEIRSAAKRSVLADGFVDDLVSVYALNVFATAFELTGDRDAAAGLVQRLGTRRTEYPWVYLADHERLYGELLAG